MSDSYNSLLRQFEACAPQHNGRRRLTGAQVAQWRMQRGHVAAFADALCALPSEGQHDALLRYEYLAALVDVGLLDAGVLQRFNTACMAAGLTQPMESVNAAGSAASGKAATTQLEPQQQQLQRLLDRCAAQHSIAQHFPGAWSAAARSTHFCTALATSMHNVHTHSLTLLQHARYIQQHQSCMTSAATDAPCPYPPALARLYKFRLLLSSNFEQSTSAGGSGQCSSRSRHA